MRARLFSFSVSFSVSASVSLLAGLMGVGVVACTEPIDDGPPPPPVCSATTYRIATAALASTWGDAVRLGLDLDGDGDVDNKLGSLNATLTQVYGDWHPEAAMAELLADRSTAWMLRVERCAGTAGLAVSLGVGTDDDGDGRLAVGGWGEPAVGEGLEARGGIGLLPVGRLGAGASAAGGADDGWSPELGMAVALHAGTRDLTATLGFGVEVTDALLAPVAGFLSAALARGDSRFAAGIDLDRDGVVSVAELRQAPAVRTLLASDLDLAVPCGDGECYQPGSDGVLDRISLGLGITARPAAID